MTMISYPIQTHQVDCYELDCDNTELMKVIILTVTQSVLGYEIRCNVTGSMQVITTFSSNDKISPL